MKGAENMAHSQDLKRKFSQCAASLLDGDFSIDATALAAATAPRATVGKRLALLYDVTTSLSLVHQAIVPTTTPYALTEGYKHKYVRRVEHLADSLLRAHPHGEFCVAFLTQRSARQSRATRFMITEYS